jgi:predicted membrane channel-forming protein YqfA (hemolysin III family)
MYNKLNDLRFVIGLFFSVVSLILILSVLLSSATTVKLNIYTGVGFFVFGMLMMFLRSNKHTRAD